MECLEQFIAEWNQCLSRISLYRFYWAYHFGSARDLSWHCSPLYELLTWNCWRTWIATKCWLGMWPCYKRYMRMPPYFVAIECYKRIKTQYLGTFTLKYLYLRRISWPLFKEAFLRVFELGWKFGVNLRETHFIADPVLIVFVHFQAWGPMHKS